MPKLESKLQAEIKTYLQGRGWWVEVFTCNAFQVGIPDLIAFRDNGNTVRWIDVKRPKVGTLTRHQARKWSQWDEIGVGVWIMTECDDSVLYAPANWREWWKPRYQKYLAKSPAQILRDLDHD